MLRANISGSQEENRVLFVNNTRNYTKVVSDDEEGL